MERTLPRSSSEDSEISLLKRLLFENAVQHWRGYAISIVLLFIVSGATGATAYVMEDVINKIFVNREAGMLWPIAAAVMAVFIAKGAANYGNTVILTRIGNSIVAGIQNRMFDKISSLDIGFYERTQMGDLVVRFTHNAVAARNAINLIMTSVFRDALSLASLVTVMILQQPFLSLVVLVVAPLAVFGTLYLMKAVKALATGEFLSLARVVTVVKETFSGIKIIKAFGLETRMKSEMRDAVAGAEYLANALVRFQAITVPLMETLGGLAVGAAILIGGYNVIEHGEEPGSFFSFITALLLAYEPARRLSGCHVAFQTSMIGVRIIYNLLDTPHTVSDTPGAVMLDACEGHISFDNVTYDYGGGPALQNLSLEFRPGEVTALVGPSGAGKSTIFSLIERFRDPQQGKILLDGRDIRTIDQTSLRQQIALVAQDSFLFDGSIRDNIGIGRADATDDEIVVAAKAANADEFIIAQPDGYDAAVGDHGVLLSGGQRQRIAIARAMLRDSQILLLDEATSALDTLAEEKIQQALNRLMKGRTTIVIAHRLSTIRHADRVHVLENGRLVESGTHDDLISAHGLYSKLHKTKHT